MTSTMAACKEDDETPCFIFVIGAPGAGKGTLSKRLARDSGFTHISIGDLLRENVKNSPAIARYVKNGELLPSDHLIPLLRETLLDCRPWHPIIVDGFPRRSDQIQAFEKAFGEPRLVLFFQCPRELAKGRVLTRKDGRAGDNSEVFDKRYKEYLTNNPAILDYYGSTRGNGKLIEIDTSGETDVSYKTLRKALQAREEWPGLTGSPRSPRSSP